MMSVKGGNLLPLRVGGGKKKNFQGRGAQKKGKTNLQKGEKNALGVTSEGKEREKI